MTFYCNNCKNLIDESDLIGSGESFRGRESALCPRCHSDRVVEAWTCDLCGEPTPPDEPLCEGCKVDISNAWHKAVKTVAEWHKKPLTEFNSIEQIILDFLEREVM